MAMTIIEKIISSHSEKDCVKPGDIVDITIDVRVARDFGGANVVKHLRDNMLSISDPARTLFTFDCNPTGSDQKYAVNQHICRLYARENNIKVFDIDSGIGTHLLIDEGFVTPGSTAVSTDSHANILGAVGAFGQGMGDMDIAAAWNKGKLWFRVPQSAKIVFTGDLPQNISAKDIVLNMLGIFGANSLLGYAIEMYGNCIGRLTLDQRITISSMATEMGAIIIFFPPSQDIISYCRNISKRDFLPVFADEDAAYQEKREIDISIFKQMISRPGQPHDVTDIDTVIGEKIDSAFIGSCTNGRIEDMRAASSVLADRKVATGVVLKIVPATDAIWKQCLREGIIETFKNAGALVSNAGCAGCAAGQVGQNEPGEVTISTGNRNFPGKQGKGDVFLASPEVVAASAIAGYITTPDKIPSQPAVFSSSSLSKDEHVSPLHTGLIKSPKPEMLEGRIRIIRKDNIDTDMIFHNRYLAVTDMKEMGQYTFDNLAGQENFAKETSTGDILIVHGKNFGSGSSRQQAVDCFLSLGIQAIMAESFGAIYERNAINAALPVLTCKSFEVLDLKHGDKISIDLRTGLIRNISGNKQTFADPFSAVQMEIYQNGGLLA